MKKRIVALALTMTMVVAALVGCGGSDKKETKAETKAAETTAATEAAGETTAEATGDAEYAVILKTQASDFWMKMWTGVEEKAAELGIKVDLYSHRVKKISKDSSLFLKAVSTKDTKVSLLLLCLL